MRRWIAVFAVLTLCSAAQAAPICQNRAGDPVHCDSKDAMPLGWTLPAAERALHPLAPPTDTRLATETVLIVILFLAMIGFLPEFDGREDADWVEKKPTKRR
jgi:hypothetical protein